MDFTGKQLWSYSMKTFVMPNTSKTYYAVDLPVISENLKREEVVLSIKLEDAKKETVAQTLEYFASPKDLNLPQPKISFDVQNKNGASELKLKTDVLAKNIYLDFEADTESFFSDNFFDLTPNEERTIKIKTPQTLEEIKRRLKIKTLVDSY
jgi:beta-mannosidase